MYNFLSIWNQLLGHACEHITQGHNNNVGNLTVKKCRIFGLCFFFFYQVLLYEVFKLLKTQYEMQ